jgi:outer membrane murein-binding lipoprotein Lpp
MQQHKIKLAAAAVAIGLVSFAAGTLAQGRYPEINQAVGSLNAALGALEHARDFFGGHKVAAERLIQQAIGELRAGEADAAAHGR